MRQASGARESGKAILRIDGDSDDRVNFLDDGWTRLEATRTIDGTEYAVYDHADARVLVALDIVGAAEEPKTPSTEIEGTAGADTLTGTDGDDTIEGMAGADTIIGGAGTDTASYKSSGVGVRVNLATGAASGGHAEGDTLSGIENLIGSDHNDILTGSDGDNVILGGDGHDKLKGKSGNDRLEGGRWQRPHLGMDRRRCSARGRRQ